MTDNAKRKEIVQGVWDHSTGEFLDCPDEIVDFLEAPAFDEDGNRLPMANTVICRTDISLGKAEWKDWSEKWGEDSWRSYVGDTPLAVEFRVRFLFSKEDLHYIRNLMEVLGVEPEDLPDKSTLEVTDKENEAIDNAMDAIQKAVGHAMLRWSNLEEASVIRTPDIEG
jgi:hypothetical protein